MSNFFLDNDDLRFYVDHGIDWDALVGEVETDGDTFSETSEATDFYRDILELMGEFSASEIAPHAAEIDREEMRLVDGEVVVPPRLTTIFEKIREMELHGMCLPREMGGMNCPLLVYVLAAEILARGDVSVMTHHGFYGGIAMALMTYSALEGSTEFDPETMTLTHSRFSREIAEIMRGDAWGSMDITEPDAGSDMGALRSIAEQDDEGNWFLSGQKIFITSGHGKYHIVICRTAGSKADDERGDGLDGLSLFLAEAYRDDESGQRTRFATLERVEEKLGHHGSATVTVNFDRTPARLIGEVGEGFKMMLLLMNNARIAVGFEAIGLCEAAAAQAREYASVRQSMGKTIDRHEIIADYLDEMDTDIRGIRALAVKAAFNEELSNRRRIRARYLTADGSEPQAQLEAEVSELQWKSRKVTPLIKFISAEKAVEISRRTVQIHGGSGYMTEYGAEKLLRDAMVLPIYEGTSQIQALMATKDNLLGIARDPMEFLRSMVSQQVTSRIVSDPLARRTARIRRFAQEAQVNLMLRILGAKVSGLRGKPASQWKAVLSDWDPKRDFSPALLHAERLTWILADAAICEELQLQAHAHPHRRELLARYSERAEPRARQMLDTIRTTGARLLSHLGRSAPSGQLGEVPNQTEARRDALEPAAAAR